MFLKLVGQARRRGQARPRAMPNIPWPPRNRFTCTRSAPRPGEAVVGDGGTIITQDFDRYPIARMQSVPVDAHGRCRSRPVRSSRS